jgi:hypothetical protein
MLGVFAEFEGNFRRERQLEGIAKAKAAGVYKGRPATIEAAQVRRTGLCSGERIPPGKGSARPETGAALLASLGRLWAAETTLFCVTGGKATESQRLFRRRQESGIARDCVVGLIGLELATKRLWSPETSTSVAGHLLRALTVRSASTAKAKKGPLPMARSIGSIGSLTGGPPFAGAIPNRKGTATLSAGVARSSVSLDRRLPLRGPRTEPDRLVAA